MDGFYGWKPIKRRDGYWYATKCVQATNYGGTGAVWANAKLNLLKTATRDEARKAIRYAYQMNWLGE